MFLDGLNSRLTRFLGFVKNVTTRRVNLHEVDSPVALYQTNGAHS